MPCCCCLVFMRGPSAYAAPVGPPSKARRQGTERMSANAHRSPSADCPQTNSTGWPAFDPISSAELSGGRPPKRTLLALHLESSRKEVKTRSIVKTDLIVPHFGGSTVRSQHVAKITQFWTVTHVHYLIVRLFKCLGTNCMQVSCPVANNILERNYSLSHCPGSTFKLKYQSYFSPESDPNIDICQVRGRGNWRLPNGCSHGKSRTVPLRHLFIATVRFRSILH